MYRPPVGKSGTLISQSSTFLSFLSLNRICNFELRNPIKYTKLIVWTYRYDKNNLFEQFLANIDFADAQIANADVNISPANVTMIPKNVRVNPSAVIANDANVGVNIAEPRITQKEVYIFVYFFL